MSRIPENERLEKLCEPDRAFWGREGILLAEWTRSVAAPLAGPVVVCCAAMPPEPLIAHVNDSKKVSEKRREALYPGINGDVAGVCIRLGRAGYHRRD